MNVRDIQRRLRKSKAVILLATRKVTEINKGQKTVGIDRFRALSTKSKGQQVDKLLNRDIRKHKPKPTIRRHIPKKKGW